MARTASVDTSFSAKLPDKFLKKETQRPMPGTETKPNWGLIAGISGIVLLLIILIIIWIRKARKNKAAGK